MVSKPSRSVKQTVPLVRIHLAPPPSPYLWRYLARITEKPAPAASFANMWSRRKSLSGSEGQFPAKISLGKFGATVWAGGGIELRRTKRRESPEIALTNLFRPRVPARSKEAA